MHNIEINLGHVAQIIDQMLDVILLSSKIPNIYNAQVAKRRNIISS